MNEPTIVVTRHQALVQYLHECKIIPADARHAAHVAPEDVAGCHVFGVLPLHLAALARSVTVIPLDVPAELRGRSLTLEQVREYAGCPKTYQVLEVAG